jgi:hypothetical protein
MKFFSWFVLLINSSLMGAQVNVIRTPDQGIQPQAVVDKSGVLHLIYFKGKSGGGDVFYCRRAPGQEEFSKPLRVNSRSGSVIATGTIRGAQLAVGKNGRPHVSWMGGEGCEQVRIDGKPKTPMLYSRLDMEKGAFEPERSVLTFAAGLDGGGSMAADEQGNVYVAWHGNASDQLGEAGRAVFVATSKDEGKTFAREKQANPVTTGACGCCGMRAFADSKGKLYLLYRAATDKTERGMNLLVAPTGTDAFRLSALSQWKLGTCVMSSAWMAEGGGSVLAAWEAENQVQFSIIDPPSLRSAAPVSPSGSGKRKHPAVARNSDGETLLAWTENTGWARGGSLAWQLYDSSLKPIGEKGRRDGVPVWGLVSAVASAKGDFVIIY